MLSDDPSFYVQNASVTDATLAPKGMSTLYVLAPVTHQHGNVDWARAPMEKLASNGELMAYQYEGFWQCMDTLRDKVYLQELWETGDAPWKVWN